MSCSMMAFDTYERRGRVQLTVVQGQETIDVKFRRRGRLV